MDGAHDPADARGLTPLVWGHVSPYGAFDLDMERRLDLAICRKRRDRLDFLRKAHFVKSMLA